MPSGARIAGPGDLRDSLLRGEEPSGEMDQRETVAIAKEVMGTDEPTTNGIYTELIEVPEVRIRPRRVYPDREE